MLLRPQKTTSYDDDDGVVVLDGIKHHHGDCGNVAKSYRLDAGLVNDNGNDNAIQGEFEKCVYMERIEQLRIWPTADIMSFSERSKWKNLRRLIRIEGQRRVNGQTYRELTFSLPVEHAAKLQDHTRLLGHREPFVLVAGC
jgi:hypothetical protein